SFLPAEQEQFDYEAFIDWGDGTTPSVGTIALAPDQESYTVTGTHTYTAETTYLVRFLVFSPSSFNSGSADCGPAIAPVHREDAPLDSQDFHFLDVGGGTLVADAGPVHAELTEPDGTRLPATLFAAHFDDDPFQQDRFFNLLGETPLSSEDVRVTGGSSDASITITFTIPGATSKPDLFFFDSTAHRYLRV